MNPDFQLVGVATAPYPTDISDTNPAVCDGHTSVFMSALVCFQKKKRQIFVLCLQVDAMKTGAKEMKKAYKDVKLDQIDVRLSLSVFSVL